jgi:small subunit ribosomal protein S16
MPQRQVDASWAGLFLLYLVAGDSCADRPWLPGSIEPIPKTSSFERILTVLMIRLARVGARKQPYYRVVVIEKDRARNGRSIEVVGTYNPRTNPASIDLKRERIDYWTSKGAQFSDRVAKLVAKQPAATTTVAA